MISRSRQALTGLALVLALFAAVARPAAQEPSSGGAMQGLSMNSDQPVKIESNTLEVRDKIRQATFIGRRQAHPGRHDTQMQDAGGVLRGHRMAPAKKGAAGAAPQAQKSGGG